ncbi:3-oxoacyl-ACP synthase III family protein [Gemmatirosa kalamazoonensis]|uniref:3-oxoacyl-ACP synthase III family protein n=1 Tax=Gemmatirosa kalamazoonensis TaxID=861299 RepID=UPI00046CCC17|nr:ketoacyl-ACP synthase III [Gemmatirosa kalamazoonensis]
MRHAAITGTGSYAPARVVTNAELSAALGTDVDDFVSNTLGIRERRWCADDESTADLAERAARRALNDAGVAAEDVDLLIVATDTPEYVSPATSAVVQGRLGAWRAGTFDVNSGCAGFVTALDVAWKYVRADERYSRVLVVGAYAMSKFLDRADKKTSTIFADGAGAVMLEASRAHGIVASELYADGRLAPGMGVFAGGTAEPITEAVLREGYRNRLRFVQKYPASVNEEGWPRIARSVLARAGASVDDVGLWLWTQVNRSTIETVMRTLDAPMERAHTVMHKWGYTGSACLPMALDDAARAGRLGDGDLVLLTGSGAGLSMGCVALRWRDA